MSVVYAIICAAALAMAVLCCVLDQKKDLWLRLFFIAVFICDLGYFLVSVSRTLSMALTVHQVVFFGNVFLPLTLMMKIMHMCGAKYPKAMPSALVILGLVMVAGAFGPGEFGLYYTCVSIERIDGVTRLIREFSPWFAGYALYYAGYTVVMLAIVFRAARAKRLADPNHAGFLVCVVMINLVVWIVQKIVPGEFEILTVTYLLSELFILFMHKAAQDYEKAAAPEPVPAPAEPLPEKVPEPEPAPEVKAGPESWSQEEELLFSAEWIDSVLAHEELSALTDREKTVLRHILSNKKRREIAEMMVVTESTIKKHISQIYKKLGVKGRIELFVKLKNLVQ